jgi:hypothetical protein
MRLQDSTRIHYPISVQGPRNFTQIFSRIVQQIFPWKNMLTNIDYMIDYGQLMNDPKAAKVFDDMEKFVQDSKFKIQQLVCLTNSPNQKKDQLNLQHSLEKRRNPSPD